MSCSPRNSASTLPAHEGGMSLSPCVCVCLPLLLRLSQPACIDHLEIDSTFTLQAFLAAAVVSQLWQASAVSRDSSLKYYLLSSHLTSHTPLSLLLSLGTFRLIQSVPVPYNPVSSHTLNWDVTRQGMKFLKELFAFLGPLIICALGLGDSLVVHEIPYSSRHLSISTDSHCVLVTFASDRERQPAKPCIRPGATITRHSRRL